MTSPQQLGRYAGVRVAVFGATGFVGRSVATALAARRAELHLVLRDARWVDRDSRRTVGEARLHELDARNLGSLPELLGRIRPDLVFNLVGYGVDPDEKRAADPALARRLNAEFPVALVETLAGVPSAWAGRRIVHVGSVYEYGPIGGDLDEGSVPQPVGLYPTTKLAGTRGLQASCQAAGVSGLTARLCQLYGPGEHRGRLLPTLIEAHTSGSSPRLTVGTQRKDFTYVEDVAEGLLRLGLTVGPPGEIVNLATGRLTSVRDFALTAAHLLPLPAGALRFENPVDPNELMHDPIAIARLQCLTGWTPTTAVADGIGRTLAFERS